MLQGTIEENAKKERSRSFGAVVILLLLGMPWIMDAFVAIEAAENRAAEFFQKATSVSD